MTQLDRLAVRLLLKGDEAGLRRLAQQATAAIEAAHGERCPYCDSRNTEAGHDAGRCDDCGEQWDADEAPAIVAARA